eukprot:m.213474 g.213474  ORF g.213474 m.213474 type:complete len:782 (-) comp15860_c5_seq11:1677-4022(-)
MDGAGEARFLKRKVKAGHFDVHPTENAIVVNYEVEAVILSDYGEPMLGELKRCQKNIRIKSLSESTNIPELAASIAERCKLIPAAKLPELEQLLAYILKRGEDREFRKAAAVAAKKRKKKSLLDHNEGRHASATIADIDDYIALLYDELPDKIKGTGLILQVAENPDNMEELVHNEPLMGALSRLLREEGMKSPELLTNIVHFFYYLSNFTHFHDVLKQYKVGAQCMKIISQELKRYESWEASFKRKQKKIKSGKYSEEDVRAYMTKYEDQCFQQEALIFVTLHLLLNLAEDTRVQIKMRNKMIVQDLMTLLGRDNAELLSLVVNFLKKLSIFAENKNDMKDGDIVKKLAGLLHSDNEELLKATLSLVLNLSFDVGVRVRIVELGLLPRLVELISNSKIPSILPLKVLYHLSLDDSSKHQFATTNCIHKIMSSILDTREQRVELELAALAINLAANVENAKQMCEGKKIHTLMQRALETEDQLLFKLLRNISIHEDGLKEIFLDYVDDISSIMTSSRNEDLVIETLGILGNLTIAQFDYEQLLREYDLIDWMNERLLPAAADDDIVLQVVVLLGTVLVDEQCAEQVARSGIVQNLIEVLKAKQEDDEIVLQIVYVFYKLVYHEATRGLILGQTGAVSYLIDLMHDKNTEIRKVCDSALDIIMEHDDVWARQINMQKFQFHNSQWLETVLGGGGHDNFMDHDDQEMFHDDFMHDASELDPYGGGMQYEDNSNDELFDDPDMYFDADRFGGSGRLAPTGSDNHMHPDDYGYGKLNETYNVFVP